MGGGAEPFFQRQENHGGNDIRSSKNHSEIISMYAQGRPLPCIQLYNAIVDKPQPQKTALKNASGSRICEETIKIVEK